MTNFIKCYSSISLATNSYTKQSSRAHAFPQLLPNGECCLRIKRAWQSMPRSWQLESQDLRNVTPKFQWWETNLG